MNTIKNKHHGVINNIQEIEQGFKIKNFKIINYIYARDSIIFYASKDYSKKFNIEFNGEIVLEVIIKFDSFNILNPCLYPKFKEISNIIPKKADNHIYSDGSICYAPPYRPIYEKWRFINFVNAVDSMINNYFSKQYIGIGSLVELEHGKNGLKQYLQLISQKVF